MNRTGKLLKDDDGHQYLVPIADTDEFYEMLTNTDGGDDVEACDQFDERFKDYRLSSHLSTYTVTIHEDL